MTKRIDYLDNLGGLLICYMMLSHILCFELVDFTIESIWLEPLRFFMFWFFFKSGMFYVLKERRQIVASGGGKLLVPLVKWLLLGHVVQCVKLFVCGDYDWKHYLLTPIKELFFTGSTTGNQPLWFLFSLFCVQFAFNELKRRKVNTGFILLMGVLVPTALFYLNKPLPIYFANVPLGMSAYALGYMLKEKQFGKKVLVASLIVYLGIMIMLPSYLDFRSNALNENGNYILAVLFGLSGCVVFNNLFKRLPHMKILQFMGKNSMEYYVTHWIILNVCSLALGCMCSCGGVALFIVMIAACLFIPTMIVKIKNI